MTEKKVVKKEVAPKKVSSKDPAVKAKSKPTCKPTLAELIKSSRKNNKVIAESRENKRIKR